MNAADLSMVPVFESVKYRASIDVIGKHLSGILVFKTQEDSSIRTVFVNEMGVTFFDLTFFDERYTFNAIMESMDRKAVKRSLAKDLGMILMRGIFEKNLKHVFTTDSQLKPAEFKLQRKGTVKYHRVITFEKMPAESHSELRKEKYLVRPEAKEIPLIENFGRRKKVISIAQFYNQQNPMPDSIFVKHHQVDFTISLKQLHVTE